jgi:hypothetical protein
MDTVIYGITRTSIGESLTVIRQDDGIRFRADKTLTGQGSYEINYDFLDDYDGVLKFSKITGKITHLKIYIKWYTSDYAGFDILTIRITGDSGEVKWSTELGNPNAEGEEKEFDWETHEYDLDVESGYIEFELQTDGIYPSKVYVDIGSEYTIRRIYIPEPKTTQGETFGEGISLITEQIRLGKDIDFPEKIIEVKTPTYPNTKQYSFARWSDGVMTPQRSVTAQYLKAYYVPAEKLVWEKTTIQYPMESLTLYVQRWIDTDKNASLLVHAEKVSSDSYLQAYDKAGNSVFRYRLSAVGVTNIDDIALAYNGDTIAMYGYVYDDVSPWGVLLYAMDKSGNVLWIRELGNVSYGFHKAVRVSDDGSWVVWAGLEGRYPNQVFKVKVIKRDQSTEYSWTPYEETSCIAIDANAEHIICGEIGRTEIYSRTGDLLFYIDAVDYECDWVDASLGGRYYAVLASDYINELARVYFIDLQTNSVWTKDVGFCNPPHAIKISPDGNYVVFIDNQYIYVYNKNGTEIFKTDNSPYSLPKWVFFTNNHRIVAGVGGYIWMWDMNGNRIFDYKVADASQMVVERDYGEYVYLTKNHRSSGGVRKKAYLVRTYQAVFP